MGKWLKSPRELTFEVRDRIAYITLNRPEKRNALSINLHREIVAACMEADDLTEVRVVVIQGAGVDFCAGVDIASGPPPIQADEMDYDPADHRDHASVRRRPFRSPFAYGSHDNRLRSPRHRLSHRHPDRRDRT